MSSVTAVPIAPTKRSALVWLWLGIVVAIAGAVALCGALLLWRYHRLSHLVGGDKRPLLIALAGFSVLLFASCGIEGMRFWSHPGTLPLAPGGLVGPGCNAPIG